MNKLCQWWTGKLNSYWPTPAILSQQSLELEEESEEQKGCCYQLGRLYRDFSVVYSKEKEEYSIGLNKAEFAASFIFFPLTTQKYMNDRANRAFGKMRSAHGLKEKIFTPLKTAAWQSLALLNYSWTVVSTLLPISQNWIIAAVSLLASEALDKISECFSLDWQSASSSLFRIGITAFLIPVISLRGFPRALLGLPQKIATISFIPAYLMGRAVIDVKNALKSCCYNTDQEAQPITCDLQSAGLESIALGLERERSAHIEASGSLDLPSLQHGSL